MKNKIVQNIPSFCTLGWTLSETMQGKFDLHHCSDPLASASARLYASLTVSSSTAESASPSQHAHVIAASETRCAAKSVTMSEACSAITMSPAEVPSGTG